MAAHARGIIYSHPPSCFARHPPPTEPPTQTMFARGPVVAVGIRVWYRSGTLFSIIVTTPTLRATPPQRGTLSRDGTRPSFFLHKIMCRDFYFGVGCDIIYLLWHGINTFLLKVASAGFRLRTWGCLLDLPTVFIMLCIRWC